MSFVYLSLCINVGMISFQSLCTFQCYLGGRWGIKHLYAPVLSRRQMFDHTPAPPSLALKHNFYYHLSTIHAIVTVLPLFGSPRCPQVSSGAPLNSVFINRTSFVRWRYHNWLCLSAPHTHLTQTSALWHAKKIIFKSIFKERHSSTFTWSLW